MTELIEGIDRREAGAWSEELTVTILGRLSVAHKGGQITAPSAPKERKLLALLLLNYGRIVPVHLLVDELWGSNPPRKARAALHTYLLNIRSKLARDLALPGPWVRDSLVVTNKEGYQFRIAECYFDLQQYECLADLGEKALASGDEQRAAKILREAEGLWHGPILPDVEHGLPLQSEIARLEQRRLTMQELRIESELHTGRHRLLVSELSMLTLQHPYNERLHEYLMLALHRSGRTVQALEVFQRLHSSMRNEMGMHPSGRIQQVQQEILAPQGDPAPRGRGRG